MYKNHSTYRPVPDSIRLQPLHSGNDIKINHTDSIWDPKNHHLILLLETSKDPGNNISAHMIGNRLLLEAAPGLSYSKPLRTHLVEKEFMDELEEGFMPASFWELPLKYGYRYHLISCQACDSKKIKVVLGYKRWGANGNN